TLLALPTGTVSSSPATALETKSSRSITSPLAMAPLTASTDSFLPALNPQAATAKPLPTTSKAARDTRPHERCVCFLRSDAAAPVRSPDADRSVRGGAAPAPVPLSCRVLMKCSLSSDDHRLAFANTDGGGTSGAGYLPDRTAWTDAIAGACPLDVVGHDSANAELSAGFEI